MFKVGDIVRGLVNNGYGITNECMLAGEVISCSGEIMNIKIRSHVYEDQEGEEYDVCNSDRYFALVEDELNIEPKTETELTDFLFSTT